MPKVLYPQPFPFNHYDLGIQDFVPCGGTTGRYVQGTRSQMMSLYWKVKSFSVSGSYTNYAFNDPDTDPTNTSWTGNITSAQADETHLVCGMNIVDPETGEINYRYMTQNITINGNINSAAYGSAGDFKFTGSDFYLHSDPNQAVVKLYGEFYFGTDQDDTAGITTVVGGSLAPFLINGFQVYENGSAVYYNATGGEPPIIEDFVANFTENLIWPYDP